MKSVADSLRELTASLHRERGEFERKVQERNLYLTLLMKLVGISLPTSVEHYQPSNDHVIGLVAAYMDKVGLKTPAPEDDTTTPKQKRLYPGSMVMRGKRWFHARPSDLYRLVQVDKDRVCLIGVESGSRWMDAVIVPTRDSKQWLSCAWLDISQPCHEGWFPYNEEEE